MVSLDKTYETNELKISIQTTCLITHGEREFNFQYTKRFPFECMHGDLFTHGATMVRVSRHDGEKAHEGLGTGYEDVIIYTPGLSLNG